MERDSSAPRAWINQRVAVELHDAASSGVDVATGRGVFDTRSGLLKAANEFGIELDEPVGDSGVEQPATFYPWSAVRSITLAR
jgi:hypothetical protein